MTPLIIPHRSLEPETLRAMVEDFVTRDGSDYGEHEAGIDARVQQVMRALESGKALILYDTDSETFSIGTREQLRLD